MLFLDVLNDRINDPGHQSAKCANDAIKDSFAFVREHDDKVSDVFKTGGRSQDLGGVSFASSRSQLSTVESSTMRMIRVRSDPVVSCLENALLLYSDGMELGRIGAVGSEAVRACESVDGFV